MDEYKELKGEIHGLDSRISAAEQDIVVLQTKEVNMKELVQRNVDAYDRLNVTMQSVNQNLTENTLSIKHLGAEITEVKEQGLANKQEIDSLKEERNINMMTWLKNNWVSIVLGCGLVAELLKNYL